MNELEFGQLSYEERIEAGEQLMRSAAKALPFIRGSRNAARPRPITGPSRGVKALERAKAKRIVPPDLCRVTHPR